MIAKERVLIARPCCFQSEHPDIGTWMAMTSMRMQEDPRVESIDFHWNNKHRILDNRNTIAEYAIEQGCTLLLMVDPDMRPDMYVPRRHLPIDQQPDKNPKSKPFWESSFNFMRAQGAGVVGAPAVSAPPASLVNVFVPDDNGVATRVTWEESLHNHRVNPGFHRSAAVGTGLILIDMDVFKVLPRPWFDDVYEDDGRKTDVKQSQDSKFCFNCLDHDIQVFCNWYSWAGHWKWDLQGEPGLHGDQKLFGPPVQQEEPRKQFELARKAPPANGKPVNRLADHHRPALAPRGSALKTVPIPGEAT